MKAYGTELLGAGEAEVLTLAEELQADVVLMDDERAWEVARQKGIASMRSTELILEAHRRQLLDRKTAEEELVETWQEAVDEWRSVRGRAEPAMGPAKGSHRRNIEEREKALRLGVGR